MQEFFYAYLTPASTAAAMEAAAAHAAKGAAAAKTAAVKGTTTEAAAAGRFRFFPGTVGAGPGPSIRPCRIP